MRSIIAAGAVRFPSTKSTTTNKRKGLKASSSRPAANELAKAPLILCSFIMPVMERPIFIPVILGTPRQGRQSEHAARLVLEETKKRAGVETELIDVRSLHMRLDDAGEDMKDPAFAATVERADGLILVVPEYNHGYPGLLKHALDMNLKEYIHKAVGLCGVSAGPFGGARVIENLLPVMRELGTGDHFYGREFQSCAKALQ